MSDNSVPFQKLLKINKDGYVQDNRYIQTIMYNVAICIPTYKRPLMLQKLLLSILDCNIDKSIIKDINIIVVDNDIDKTAETVVTELKEKFYENSKLHYFNYSKKGLSNVRNELFKRALEYHPDFIVGIDDDEYVTSNWLNELLITITLTGGDIAVGPGIPVFEDKVPIYVASNFKNRNLINHQNITTFQTTNFIISVNFLITQKLEFDERFNTTGAEDSFFGVTAIKRGAKLYWAGKAIAYETILKNRASLKWLLNRKFRTAITYTYILILEKNYLMLLKKILVNILYLLAGIIGLLLLPFKINRRYWGILKLAESFGGFAGLVNIKFHEYKNVR